jgi:hypothetical protein
MEYVEMTSHDEADPLWRYVDPAWHVHTYDAQGRVPSIRYVVDAESTDEYPERGHYECIQCGARVVPGRKATQFRSFMRT